MRVKAEFWVMRVLLLDGVIGAKRPIKFGELTDESKRLMTAAVQAGKLCILPDGCIAEPVEVFDDDEERAHAFRVSVAMMHPADDFRVVMNVGGLAT